MFYNDHAPPHFHAVYGADELQVGIDPITIISGEAPKRVQSLVLEWAQLHQQDLLNNWRRARQTDPLLPIDPLIWPEEGIEVHRINRVEALPGARIRLEYATGEAMDVDITPMVQRGGVFAQLADPAVFAQVRLGEGGRYVEWPGEIDLCADALFLEGSRLSHT